MCATISALSYKAKAALLFTAAVIIKLVYKEKKQPYLPENARLNDEQPVEQPQRNHLVQSIAIQTDPTEYELPGAEQKIIQGSEGIIRALIDNEPSDRIIPLIENTTPEELNTQVYGGRLALVCACSKARLDIAQALVEQGADINLPDKHNWTPLYAIVCAHEQSINLYSELTALYDRSCEYMKQMQFNDKALFEQIKITSYLLNKNADPHNYSTTSSSSRIVNDLLIKHRKPRSQSKRNMRRHSLEGGPCTDLVTPSSALKPRPANSNF